MENVQTASNVKSDYLLPAELARELDVSDRTLYRWHCERVGPPRVVVGRTILYRRAAVLEWLASREEKPAASRRTAPRTRARA